MFKTLPTFRVKKDFMARSVKGPLKGLHYISRDSQLLILSLTTIRQTPITRKRTRTFV